MVTLPGDGESHMTTNELPREPNELDRLVTAARGGDRPAFD